MYSRRPLSIAPLSGAPRPALPSLNAKSEGSSRGAVAAYTRMSRVVGSGLLLLAGILIGGCGTASVPVPSSPAQRSPQPTQIGSSLPPCTSRTATAGLRAPDWQYVDGHPHGPTERPESRPHL